MNALKEDRKVSSKQFAEAYNSLQRGVYANVRRDLIKELGWSQSTLYMRLSGARYIKEEEKTIIRTIFARYGIDVFTVT